MWRKAGWAACGGGAALQQRWGGGGLLAGAAVCAAAWCMHNTVHAGPAAPAVPAAQVGKYKQCINVPLLNAK